MYATRQPRRSVEIRYWVSPKGSQYDIHDPIVEYVTRALSPAFDRIEISFGGIVPVRTEDGYLVTRSGEWARHVLGSSTLPGGIETVEDVNLLVTDGSMRNAPTGVAVHNFASVGGARLLERTPERDAIGTVVPYTPGLLSMQVLLHEIGHLLGLAHDHGAIEAVDGGTSASPMVSGYAWMDETDQFAGDVCACGGLFPEDRGGTRYLSFAFSDCSLAELRNYRGGLVR